MFNVESKTFALGAPIFIYIYLHIMRKKSESKKDTVKKKMVIDTTFQYLRAVLIRKDTMKKEVLSLSGYERLRWYVSVFFQLAMDMIITIEVHKYVHNSMGFS